MSGIFDSFHRPINYLRISVTDRCNLSCIYCRPEGRKLPLLPRSEILSFEEIAEIASAAAKLGISKLRITGGEPLVREGICDLIRMLSRIPGIDDLSMTTNGTLLGKFARRLREAGLKRVNVSLDSLRRERYKRITRADALHNVLSGIEEARKAGLEPVKINVVVMRGVNDDEILDFARLVIEEGWHIRFIEFMPTPSANNPEWLVPVREMKSRIEEKFGELLPADPRGAGPAECFRIKGGEGTLGFIGAMTTHICFRCNRIRLTPDGKLRPCLLSPIEIDVKSILRSGGEIERKIREAVLKKPKERAADFIPARVMSEIGG